MPIILCELDDFVRWLVYLCLPGPAAVQNTDMSRVEDRIPLELNDIIAFKN